MRTSVGPYTAVVDRVAYPEPPVPQIGPAGSTIVDPVFGSRIRRITDSHTTSRTNISFRVPSSAHQNIWSADMSAFYVVDNYMTVILFSFDKATGAATKMSLSPAFYNEPAFLYSMPGLMIGASSSNLHDINTLDITTGKYTTLLNVDSLTPGLSGTYIGGVYASAGPNEKVLAFYGGTQQDKHHFAVVFDKSNPASRRVLDTKASTLDGKPTNVPLNFNLHGAAIDMSGQFVILYTTGADQTGTRKAPQQYLWDLATNHFTEMGVSALPYGHDALGYGTLVNQDCCTAVSWDAAVWQFRFLDSPLVPRDLVQTPLQPREVNWEDHTTWNNAQPGVLMPVISATYRSPVDPVAWRAWTDEIIAIQTDAPNVNPTVWRFAHHRSNVASDRDPSTYAFWYEPIANVSSDGTWVLFTSNWEKTLGKDLEADPSVQYRTDVFLVQLATTGSVTPPPTTEGTPTPDPTPTPTPTRPFSGTPAALPGMLESENYDLGGEGVAYHDLTTGNSPGTYRQDDVDIRVTTDTTGSYNLKSVRAGEWLNYTVNVATAGTYSIALRVSSLGTGGTVHFTVDGVDVTGAIALPDTGGWNTYQTVTKTGVTLPAGVHVLRLVVDAAGAGGTVADINYFTATYVPPTPPPTTGTLTFTTTALPNATLGVAYSQQIQVANVSGTATFAVVSGILPSGLTMSTSGRITGTPTSRVVYPFRIKLTDSKTWTQKTFTIQVN